MGQKGVSGNSMTVHSLRRSVFR